MTRVPTISETAAVTPAMAPPAASAPTMTPIVTTVSDSHSAVQTTYPRLRPVSRAMANSARRGPAAMTTSLIIAMTM